MSIFHEQIAIDLGTAYSIVANAHTKQFLRIPSSIALDAITRIPVAYGEAAKTMMGREHDQFVVIRPLKDGVISDFEAAGHYLSFLVNQSRRSHLALQYTILICVPWGATSVETKSYVERVQGFRTQLRIVREPFAAALGCGRDIFSSDGSTVIDLGGGTTEISTIAHGHMIHCSSLREAGTEMDQLIADGLLREKLFEVGLNTAEDIKMKFGSVCPLHPEFNFEILGLDRKTHRPGRLELNTHELRNFFEPLIKKIEWALEDHIRVLPPEHQAALSSQGVHIVGGGAKLGGWKTRLEKSLGIPIHISEEPQLAVIRGLQKILQNPARYRSLLKISERLN